MSLLLSIYTETACEEVLLPAINNADHTVSLSASKFGLRKPLNLELEILDHQWRVKSTGKYTVFKGSEDWLEKPFSGTDVLSVLFDNTLFTLLVLEQSTQIGAYEKLSTSRLGRISVGKESQCDICYHCHEVISRHHLSMNFNGRVATLEDHSTNGVYVNGQRIRGTANLQFGDVISVFGLKMVYLHDVLAVNATECGAKLSENIANYAVEEPAERTAPAAIDRESQEQLFHRSPRKQFSLHTEPEEIEGPPQKQVTNRKPMWMIIGPSLTMALPMLLGFGFMAIARTMTGTGGNVFMYMGLVTAVASAIISVTWATEIGRAHV